MLRSPNLFCLQETITFRTECNFFDRIGEHSSVDFNLDFAVSVLEYSAALQASSNSMGSNHGYPRNVSRISQRERVYFIPVSDAALQVWARMYQL